MTLRGKINNINKDFFEAVRNTAMKGNVDAEGGLNGTRKIAGYVCKVHPLDDEDERLRGTVDVQEYGYSLEDGDAEGAGYPEGVMCSAIQANECGMYMMPTLLSDVVIVQDPVSLAEYVLMYSHVDVIQMEGHKKLKMGVKEIEPTKESDVETKDSEQEDEHKETGNAAMTEYDKGKIEHTVKAKNGSVVVTQTAEGVEIKAKDSTITVTADGKVTIAAKEVEFKGGSLIRKGKANLDGQGGFCGIPVCPFTGAVHTGSIITKE